MNEYVKGTEMDVEDSSATKLSARTDDRLFAELDKIAVALGRMFPGLCEVVLHDLRDPQHSTRLIENNLSGRQVGDSATELGMLRILDPNYPSVVQNYANTFPDGRPAKSTSIGIKGSDGTYIAALCLNLDISVLSPMTLALANLAATEVQRRDEPLETLRDHSSKEIRSVIESFAAQRSAAPRTLSKEAKRELVQHLKQSGYFDLHDAASKIADLLGISRATVYNYTK